MTLKPFITIRELQAGIAQQHFSIRDVVAFYADRFTLYDKELKSALEVFAQDSILRRAEKQTGKLSGIPGLIKDNICMRGRLMTCASKILENYHAPYDATVIQRLEAEGAPLMGRANMDEFAMGSSTETSAYQKTCNPWDTTRVPGGSSGGSIAAVAAGLVPWALGTETGGSVRQPAALCGIVGMKPTYGLISRYGVVAYASSLDQVGVATRTVYDNAVVMSVIAGQDEHDATTRPEVKNKEYTSSLTGTLKPGLKIGVIENALYASGVSPEVQQAAEDALKEFEKLGATVTRLALPSMDYSAAIYMVVSRAEAASNLARFDGIRYGRRSKQAETLQDVYRFSRAEGFGEEVKRRILIGNYVLSAGHADKYYAHAKNAQSIMRDEFLKAFETVDLLFLPTSPTGAFKFNSFDDNRLAMDLQDYFTAPANLIGVPAISVPCGFTSEKLPIGFQLMGPDLSEELIYQSAYAYEQATPWHLQVPEKYK